MQRTTIRLGFMLFVLSFVACSHVAVAQEKAEQKLVLVNEGKSTAPVILYEDAPAITRQAAEELVKYIGMVTGDEPRLIIRNMDWIPDSAIWVGMQPAVREAVPDLDLTFNHPEEILIAATSNHMVIAGRDVWLKEGLTVDTGRAVIEGRQQEYGTANAIYTFLQDYLNIRWFWPGETGEDVPKQSTIAFAPFEYRYHPQIRARSGIFSYSALGRRSYGRSEDWVRKQRLQLSSLEFSGGHAFGDWWERFHESNPEYFALQPDGTRSGFPSAKTTKLCLSNPNIPKRWLEDVEAQLESDPSLRIFNASPNDSWASGHCVCENCRAWDHPDGERRLFRWAGLGLEYVALSDRHVTFANACAKLLKERYPDKDYYVLMMSYGHSRPAPVKATPAENVIVSCVANFLNRDGLVDIASTRGQTYKQQMDDWSKVAPKLIWRPNVGSPAGWQQAQLDVSITQTIEDFKFIAERNCIGIFIDMVWEHWAPHGPQYYVMAQLAWDPSKDGNAILKDYYTRCFGPAADAMSRYWQLAERKRDAYRTGTKPYVEIYDDAFFKEAQALIDEAWQATTYADPVYGERINFVRTGLTHMGHIMDIRRLMTEYWDGSESDESIAQQVRDKWTAIEQIPLSMPHSINWGPIRPFTSRMAGLHPEYKPTRKFNKRDSAAMSETSDGPVPQLTTAEKAGWELVFEDDFEREQLGDTWKAIDGNWAIVDGALRGSGTIICTQNVTKGKLVHQRIEFEATTDVPLVELPGGGVPLTPRVGDLSPFIAASPKQNEELPWNTGYFFQFGGKFNSANRLLAGGVEVAGNQMPKVRIEHNKKHHIVVEFDAGQIRCFVDGKPVLYGKANNNLLTAEHGHAGFYFYTDAKVENVRIYTRPLGNDLDL